MSANKYLWPVLSLLLWFLNAQDTVWTLEGLRAGVIREANPLMRWLIDVSPPGFVMFKFGLISMAIIVLGQLAIGRNLARLGLLLGLVVYVPLSFWHLIIRMTHV